MKTLKELEKRIISLSYKKRLSHLGSCLTALPIIWGIHNLKKPNEVFVLSSGHAGLALYVVLEKVYGHNAEKLFNKHGVHPNRDIRNHIWASTGSLGHGIGISVGMALADRSRSVYCLLSDGECAEGSVWEALEIMRDQKVKNLKVFCNINNYGAYRKIDGKRLAKRLKEYGVKPVFTKFPDWKFIKDPQEFHYKVLSKEEYEQIK